VPARFAPAGAAGAVPELLAGRRLAVPVEAGGPVGPLLLEPPAPPPGAGVGRGQRAAEVVAAAAPGTIAAGARVDVLVTRDRGAGAGGTELALQDVEVLAARPAGAGEAPRRPGTRTIAATLRVTVRQAVYLAAAGSFAREVRLLARAPGDRGRVGAISAAG
jgi:pilus assembly protein CpaB